MSDEISSTALAARPTGRREHSRVRLLDTPLALVEDLRRSDAQREKSAEEFCDAFQVCLPYRGLFVWHVGANDVVGDANQVVFVRAGESYRMSNPTGAYAELIVTPDCDTLSEIARTSGKGLAQHPLFRRRCWPASASLQLFRTQFHAWAATVAERGDPLLAEELVIALIRCALQDDGRWPVAHNARTAKLVRRTKEFLEEKLSTSVSLTDVGRAVGASSAYLTNVFRRIEGMPLHRYLTRLRLAHALVELPHNDDITAVALAAGFCSHSHFTLVFRRTFGCTPSEFRESARAVRF